MVLCDAFQHARLSLNTAGSLCDAFRCMFTGGEGDFAVCSKNLEGSLFGTAKPRTSLRKPVFSCSAAYMQLQTGDTQKKFPCARLRFRTPLREKWYWCNFTCARHQTPSISTASVPRFLHARTSDRIFTGHSFASLLTFRRRSICTPA